MPQFFASPSSFRHPFACVCIATALLLSSALAVAQDSFLIAAGAGYKRPIDEIAQAFEASSGVKVERFYGHMGQVQTVRRAGMRW